MRTVTEIDKEIRELEEKLKNVEGRPTEVYSRIVGYYRSLKNWNLGKREEYSHRIVFDTPASVDEAAATDAGNAVGEGAVTIRSKIATDESRPVEYLYFFRQTCPNCPPVRSMLSHVGLPGVEMDVDTAEGTRLALEHGIYATPTVVLFDSEHEEIFRASNVAELKELVVPQPA